MAIVSRTSISRAIAIYKDDQNNEQVNLPAQRQHSSPHAITEVDLALQLGNSISVCMPQDQFGSILVDGPVLDVTH
ncbi:hypothetical protein U1Q18_046987, partial [Sarracenia purpurea var. burkii]